MTIKEKYPNVCFLQSICFPDYVHKADLNVGEMPGPDQLVFETKNAAVLGRTQLEALHTLLTEVLKTPKGTKLRLALDKIPTN